MINATYVTNVLLRLLVLLLKAAVNCALTKAASATLLLFHPHLKWNRRHSYLSDCLSLIHHHGF